MRVLRILLEKEFRQIFRNTIILRIIFLVPAVQLTIMPLAADFEADTRKLVKRLIALAEPCIILVMGVVVGFIVVAMLMAILSVTDLPL